MTKRLQYIVLIIITYGTMTVFGLVDNIKGVSYPLIKSEFQVSYEHQGLMVSVLAGSYVLFCALGGIFLGRFGIKRAFISGFICLIAGMVMVFFMPRFLLVVGTLLLVFAGFGFFEVGINALGSRLFTAKTALLMNLLHFFYGLGGVIGPKGAGILTDPAGLGLGWRWIYLYSLPLVLLFFVPAVFIRFPGEEPKTVNEEKEWKRASFLTALKTSMVWVLGVTLGLMVSAEMSIINWGGLYFQDVYGFDPSTRGANFLSVFFVLFTISRLAAGFLVEKIGYMRSLVWASLATVLVLIAGFIAGSRGIWILPVLGLFLAIMWPTLMAVAIGYFGKNAPVMTSAIITISGTLNAVMQLIIGFANRFMGAAWGYRSSCLVCTGILAVIVLFLNRRLRRNPAAP
jgi:fucose permease